MLWQLPEDQWVKGNFDRGFYSDMGASSTRIIIRDTSGLIMGATCSRNSNILSVEVVEALVAVQAIQFAQEMGFHRVEFEGDSLVVISKLKMQGLVRSTVNNYIWEVKQLVMGFERFEFQHIKEVEIRWLTSWQRRASFERGMFSGWRRDRWRSGKQWQSTKGSYPKPHHSHV